MEDNEKSQEAPRFDSSLSVSRICKIIVVGDSHVGKSCLAVRFCRGHFPDKCGVTICFDYFTKSIRIGHEDVQLQIWDTAGQERFRHSLVKQFYRDVHAVIFVYDVTCMKSFESLTKWVEECKHNCLDRDVLRILVGNKTDEKDKVVVSSTRARKFAEFHGMRHFETSAKDDAKAEQLFISASDGRRPLNGAVRIFVSALGRQAGKPIANQISFQAAGVALRQIFRF